MFGQFVLYVTLVLSIVTTVSYFISYRNNKPKKINRILYYSIVGSIIVASIYLMYNILSHNYQFTYIVNYSSNELPFYLLVSSFFAGQEGSFMLWTLLTALIGLFVIPYANKHKYEELVMSVFSLMLVFLVILMIDKNPFHYIWQTYAGEVEVGFTPANGRGMNPILENFWMAIHPPILFVGYAAASVPFAFAVAGLIKKEYQKWIIISQPWSLFATATLGLGIALGSFWSYETLGWGGFWGWDPVENASLIPWLILVALVHTLIVQKRTGGLVKTNFILAVLTYVTVLYSTFLTRSGILADTSVHSFGDPGKFAYVLLLLFQLVFLLMGVILLLFRLKDIRAKKLTFSVSSREFFITLGSLLILASTLIVFFGTSLPILQDLLNQTKKAIEISFYNQWNTPVIIAMMLINGISFTLSWHKTSGAQFFKKAAISGSLAILTTVILVIMGLDDIVNILIALSANFTLFFNLEFGLRKLSKKPLSMGTYISHAGLAFFMLGIIGYSTYSESQVLQLHMGETKQALGYDVTLKGKTEIEKELKDRQKFKYHIEVKNSEEAYIADPVIYYSAFNSFQQPFIEPGILEYLLYDIYIAPQNTYVTQTMEEVVFAKGDSIVNPLDKDLWLVFNSFDMTKINEGKLGAFFRFHTADSSWLDTLYMNIDMSTLSGDPIWYDCPNNDVQIGFINFIQGEGNMGNSKVNIGFARDGDFPLQSSEMLVFEISKKPMMLLVWIGFIGLVFGFFFPIFKYFRANKNPDEITVLH